MLHAEACAMCIYRSLAKVVETCLRTGALQHSFSKIEVLAAVEL